MPYADIEKRREVARERERRRKQAHRRLPIALAVLTEYGLLWKYEQDCEDAGLDSPPKREAA